MFILLNSADEHYNEHLPNLERFDSNKNLIHKMAGLYFFKKQLLQIKPYSILTMSGLDVSWAVTKIMALLSPVLIALY